LLEIGQENRRRKAYSLVFKGKKSLCRHWGKGHRENSVKLFKIQGTYTCSQGKKSRPCCAMPKLAEKESPIKVRRLEKEMVGVLRGSGGYHGFGGEDACLN